jgi:hypothetical protein
VYPVSLRGEANRPISPISAGDGVAEHPADAWCDHQQLQVGVVGAGLAQRLLHTVDLGIQGVDQPQCCRDIASPRVGHRQPVQPTRPAPYAPAR